MSPFISSVQFSIIIDKQIKAVVYVPILRRAGTPQSVPLLSYYSPLPTCCLLFPLLSYTLGYF